MKTTISMEASIYSNFIVFIVLIIVCATASYFGYNPFAGFQRKKEVPEPSYLDLHTTWTIWHSAPGGVATYFPSGARSTGTNVYSCKSGLYREEYILIDTDSLIRYEIENRKSK
jgi:hypothetical protein